MPKGRSAREFALDLGHFGKVTRQQATTIFRKIAIELDSRVVLSTPVDEGRARGNWWPSLNAPAGSSVDEQKLDKSGGSTIAKATATATAAKLGDTVWMTNNLPYILPLENGHSKQAPQGMVDINVDAIAAHYGGRVTR